MKPNRPTSFTSFLTAAEVEDLALWLQMNTTKVYNSKLGSDCWYWQRSCNETGYGLIAVPGDRVPRPAHCVSYELFVGPIPIGMDGDRLQLDHRCAWNATDTTTRLKARSCCNPAHLIPATREQNTSTSFNAAKQFCSHGHRFDEKNTIRKSHDGKRKCRACVRARARHAYARKIILARQAKLAAATAEAIWERLAASV